MVTGGAATRGRALPVMLLTAAVVWVALRSGTGLLAGPENGLQAAAAWPRTTGDRTIDFLADSPLGLLIARGLGLDSAREWYSLHLMAAIAAITAWALVAAAATERGERVTASRWIILSPFAAILLAWIGSYDPFTLLPLALATVGLALGRTWLLLTGSVLLGFQHFEQGLFSLAALGLAALALGSMSQLRASRGQWMIAVAGLVAGKALLAVIRVGAGGGPIGSRSEWLGAFLLEWTKTAANTGPLLLWSLFAGAWALVAWQFTLLTGTRARLLLAASLAVGLFAQFVSGDRPRVFVIVMLPTLMLITAVLLSGPARSQRPLRVVAEAMLWLGVPIVWWSADIANHRVIDASVGSLRTLLGLP